MSKFDLYVGIDPGLTGAIAVYDHIFGELTVHDMPVHVFKKKKGKKTVVNTEIDPSGLSTLLFDISASGRAMVMIEDVHSMPKQGVSSSFKFGYTAGVIRGVVAALGFPYVMVTPQRWMNHHLLRAGKDGARAKAQQMFPAYADLFRLKKNDGRADAALISLFAAHTIP